MSRSMDKKRSGRKGLASSGKLLPFLSGEYLDFKRIWLLSFFLTAGFAIVPVIFFATMDYKLTKTSMEHDAVARTSRLASNTWRSVAFFLDERKKALSFIVNSTSLDQLAQPNHLEIVLEDLRKSFGGFTDIGVIDNLGNQMVYAGPYSLEGKNYASQKWFARVLAEGTFVSEVFMGFRHVPHITLAIRHRAADGRIFILRATMEHQLSSVLSQEDTIEGSDVFLANTKGVLQTSSAIYGQVLEQLPFSLPPRSGTTLSFTLTSPETGDECIAAYRYIPDTPFVLMVVKPKLALMAPWHESQITLLKYLAASISIILLWIWWITTFLVRRLKILDHKRAKYFHLAEYANKMASIGRLAAGVAHEINNPLAIINEKAGLMKDLIEFNPKGDQDHRFSASIETILSSVARCSRITKQLLSFGRHTGNQLVPLDIRQALDEVLIFLTKEAEFRKIEITLELTEDLPKILCDHGKLQQILLNIINNALAAMEPGGRLQITAEKEPQGFISLAIADDGCGISQEHLKEIFEPFFSTKTDSGGTGLGLSITYGLVQELGGRIMVKSKEMQGTVFTVLLPLTAHADKEDSQ